MQLSQFIQDLTQQGSVTVEGQVVPFTEEDCKQAVQQLHHTYTYEASELTGAIPAFDAGAALWAAIFLYRAIQLTLLRDLGKEAIAGLLTPFSDEITPETVLSVDGSLRHLPGLMSLVKGLAPGDPLITQLRAVAAQWPFSSVGMKLEHDLNVEVIMDNDCLRRAYIDRIIEAKDTFRTENVRVNEYIQEALGGHGQLLWPGYKPLLKEQ